VWPTNDGLAMTYVAWPAEEFHAFRADLEGNLLRTLDLAGDLGERVRAGRRAERLRATPDLPNFFRKPYGPGWALVGDAGLTMDPITGRGIADAFRQAELLADAVGDGWDGPRPLDQALAGYQRQRDLEVLPMYEFTTSLASFQPPKVEEQVLLESLVGRPAEIERFLGLIAGAVPFGEYFAPGNLLKVIGVRGMAKVMLSRLRRAPRAAAPQPEPV
jgi:2-polyprenyl-6-methoxyphenol hydroxylase-like FAD-dependent oxidoreductase